MKRLLILFCFFFTAVLLPAQGKGGYLGHRLIVQAEGSYMPFNFSSASAVGLFTGGKFAYNFQYGGSIQYIISRRSQLGLSYNRYRLDVGRNYTLNGTDAEYATHLDGQSGSLLLRTFRERRGGIAPIGKFWDVELVAAQSAYSDDVTTDLDVPLYNSGLKPEQQTTLQLQFGIGTQMLFWNRVVANTGLRATVPYALKLSGNNDPVFSDADFQRDYTMRRVFSVFFGVGILL